MIYELRTYTSKKNFEKEESADYIAWETDRKDCASPCGKLLNYLSDKKTVRIPDGIETIGKGAFFRGDFDCFDLPVETLIIPASVKTIEEGAFDFTEINRIKIDPASPCGLIRNHVLYSGDGKTLLWILDDKAYTLEDSKKEEGEAVWVLVVPDGVERIGSDFFGVAENIEVLQLPASVKEIGELSDYGWEAYPKIRAPKGSEAIRLAKKRGIEYEEI